MTSALSSVCESREDIDRYVDGIREAAENVGKLRRRSDQLKENYEHE